MPPPPPIKDGFFNIYLEKIDRVLVSLALPPKCWMCNKSLLLGDSVVNIRIRGMPYRLDQGCYNQLCIGLSMFNNNMDEMKEHTSGLQ